ncbi:hypothetical protein L204_101173 [Cryptococcus depauperatus]|nr:hypothetical protein L204_00895 [Cryptococcus depauperatus CBS 7855]
MDREPLAALKSNTSLSPNATSSASKCAAAGSSTNAGALTNSNASTSGVKRPKAKLAPIFLSGGKQPFNQENIEPGSSDCSSEGSRRVRLGLSSSSPPHASSSGLRNASLAADLFVDENEDDHSLLWSKTSQNIHDYFLPSTPSNYERFKDRGIERRKVSNGRGVEPNPCSAGVWKRKRRRLGISGQRLGFREEILIPPFKPYLDTLLSSLAPYHPLTPPSMILLPSVHPPDGRPRDFAPPMAIAFNHIGKQYTAQEARSRGLRRLIGVAGEEGGVRILDVDEGPGMHREAKGWWWRAHGNAVFDMKWSADDNRVLTASGDQTSRLHALTTPTPTLLATLKGHTSSVKTSVFLDPLRSTLDPSFASSIIASAARDGNILIYDVRCRGQDPELGEYEINRQRAGSRERYRDGIPGFSAQQNSHILEPVMVLRGAHSDGRRQGRTSSRSVTSLLALKSMPGILASGGSFDGIVKLWDLRFPNPTKRCPDPRPSCTAVGMLPDPTIAGTSPSRRPRSVNAMVESPVTGDIFALCGDSKIHTLRPSAAVNQNSDEPDFLEAIRPQVFSDPNMLIQSFYFTLSVSNDGRYLASGSCKGGVMTWDTQSPLYTNGKGATRLGLEKTWGSKREKEVSSVEWGKDILAAASDDLTTRIWRHEPGAESLLASDGGKDKWLSAV